MVCRVRIFSAAIALLVAAFVLMSPAFPTQVASAEDPCPPPAGGSGQVINGPLVVDGTCLIWGATIRGDVTINGSGHLILLGSSVIGNINIVAGGRLDTGTTNIQLRTTDTVTGNIACTNAGNFTFSGTTC